MVTEYSESGKIFTDVIRKQPVEVWIQTTNQLMRGYIHIRPDARLKDEIDHQELSMAVTDAAVYNSEGGIVFETKFLALNRSQIVWIIPIREIVELPEK